MANKFINVICILSFSTFLYASQPSVIEPTENITLDPATIYLVHASHFLIKDSTAIAGASSIDVHAKRSVRLPTDMFMEIRQTLHHCVGNLVPEDAMGTTVSLGGFQIPIPIRGHNATPLAYMDLMSTFLEQQEIFGGQINDLFTTSHRYGPTAIVVVPFDTADTFHKENPNFEGEIILYNPEHQDLKTTLSLILKDKKATTINFNHRTKNSYVHPISGYEEITIDGRKISYVTLERFFHAHDIPIFNHNYSHFKMLEQLLTYFRHSFVAFNQGREDPWKFSLPAEHIPALVALAEFEFNAVFKLATRINEGQRNALEQWHNDCRHFIKLHAFEVELRKENKSLFYNNAKLQNHIQQRQSLTLDVLREELQPLEAPLIAQIEKATASPAMRSDIPQYYLDLVYHNPLDYISLTHFMTRHINEWEYGPSIIIDNLSKHYFMSLETSSEMLTAFNFALETLSLGYKNKLLPSIKERFWQYASKDSSLKGHNTLTLLNHPHLNPKFKSLLGFTGEPVNFEALLYSCPATDCLFHSGQEKYTAYKYAEFIRQKYSSQVYQTLEEATFMNSLFLQQSTELYVTPLQSESIIEPLKHLRLSPYPQPNESSNRFRVKSIIQLIKEGYFGSLEEIFTSIGLGKEFKEKFPTDEEFWTYTPPASDDVFISIFAQGTTFHVIYQELQNIKYSRAKASE